MIKINSPDKICCIVGCNYTRKIRLYKQHFFPIPSKDPERLKCWLKYMKKEHVERVTNTQVKKKPGYFYSFLVCSLHFKDSSILLWPKPRLKKNAIPELNLPNLEPENEAQSTSARVYEKTRNDDIIDSSDDSKSDESDDSYESEDNIPLKYLVTKKRSRDDSINTEDYLETLADRDGTGEKIRDDSIKLLPKKARFKPKDVVFYKICSQLLENCINNHEDKCIYIRDYVSIYVKEASKTRDRLSKQSLGGPQTPLYNFVDYCHKLDVVFKRTVENMTGDDLELKLSLFQNLKQVEFDKKPCACFPTHALLKDFIQNRAVE